MKRLTVFGVLMLLGAGCATTGTANVTPLRGQTAAQQGSDVNVCEEQAAKQTRRGTETAKGAGVGAAVGALGGAAAGAGIGAATGGDVGKSAGYGAAAGAATGAATGGAYKYSRTGRAYESAFDSCMASRGYSVSR